MSRDYCACIRTLGKAGEKYQTLLDSLKHQTIQPKKILVYIPYGYDLPKETIGIEQYVRCEKGMVHQRSLPFDEVDTEWILFLDDDLYIPEDGIEKLFIGLEENQGDCISPDIFQVQNMPLAGKLMASLHFTFPRYPDSWAFKLWQNGSYTYNNNPSKAVLQSQSAAGACFLLKKEVLLAIHFNDEQWMDEFRYPIGDDMMMAYKIHILGFRLLIHYDTSFVHLDAGGGRINNPSERYLLTQTVWFVLWYRAFYKLKHSTWKSKIMAVVAYVLRELWSFFLGAIPRSIKYRNLDSVIYFFKKYKMGLDYVKSEEYRKIPYYDEYIRKNDTQDYTFDMKTNTTVIINYLIWII